MALSTISGTTGITDATITSAKLADFSAAVDLNGVELILDADQDTTITADTDDRIDFKIAGVEHFSFSNSSGDTIIKPMVDAKDIVFQQYDGNKILEINDANYVAISGAAAGPGELRFYEDTDNGSHYTGFKAGNATASISYVLPTADGSADQVLATDGSGTLSWATASANTPSSADGQALGSASLEWSDLFLADSAVLNFGDDQDTTLTHTDGTGLTLNSTNKLCFYDTALSIHSSADGQLDLIADTEIQIAATTIDINGAVAMDGAITGATDITLSGELDAATLDISSNADIDGTTNLDAVDIDGAVQLDSTFTVGENDTGYDVKFFGASAGAYGIYDESADALEIRGATAAGAGLLKLTTGELTVVDADKLGRIDFQAPLESDGTDSTAIAASIWAEADDTFSASVNNTDLVFALGKSEAAAEKFRFTADTEIGIAGANYGTDGQVLTSGGAGAACAWEDASAGGTSWQSVETGATFTAVAGNGYPVNTTAQACTVTLPAGSVGDTIEFLDYAGTWDTNNVTLTADGSEKIKGSTDDGVLNVERQGIKIVYVDATQGWVAATGVNDDTAPAINPPAYEIEFLVVAGGGGGGEGGYGAGGGAGGYIESTQSVQSGFAITIAVGDGGDYGGGTNVGNRQWPTAGGDSSISGSGLTDKTADGGGAGGNSASGVTAGADGGSGGGSRGGSGGSATAGQGYDGGSDSAAAPYYGTAGGGGSSEVGGDGTSTTGGDGGDGTANDITGSSVTYAGGGGGGTYSSGTAGSGGTGGGGDAGASGGSNTGTNGTDGLGGGGGGASSNGSDSYVISGTGGSGIVILRMLTANYSTTVSGNETPIVDGDYTVLKFINTAGGSYTT